MNRRHLIRKLSVAGGVTLITPGIFIGCNSDDYELIFLSTDEFEFIDELSEIILPESPNSPGAKAAKVANFLDTYVLHCYDDLNKFNFQESLTILDNISKTKFKQAFKMLSTDQKLQYVSMMENDKNPNYLKCKQLILFGFFTSEIGNTEARRYVAVPGKFIGDVSCHSGDAAWAL